jgi:hypothetical protein
VRWPPAWKLVSWSNVFVVGYSPARKNVSREAEDTVEAITEQRLVKIQQTETTSYVL